MNYPEESDGIPEELTYFPAKAGEFPGLGSPPFTSHEKAIWKRITPVRGLTKHNY